MRRIGWPATVTMATATLGWACSTAGGDVQGRPCAASADCSPEEICVDGFCIPGVDRDAGTGDGPACDTVVCAAECRGAGFGGGDCGPRGCRCSRAPDGGDGGEDSRAGTAVDAGGDLPPDGRGDADGGPAGWDPARGHVYPRRGIMLFRGAPVEWYARFDLDRNGVNDWDEHGREWLAGQWDEGRAIMIGGIRERIGEDAILLLNSGRFHEFDWSETNGLMLEHDGCEYSFEYTAGIYRRWMETARTPHALLVDATRLDRKDDFARARFHIAATMFGDGYVSLADYRSREHEYVDYYDEFDLDIGYPRGEMTAARTGGDRGRGVWVRFFDRGAVVLNQNDEPAAVADADLRAVPGYDGPYRRFRGGQDPAVNDGDPFLADILDGRTGNDADCWIGDARILVREPTTAVAEIIVDNVPHHTSPGSSPAALDDPWVQACDETTDEWAQGCRDWSDQWGLAYDESRSGTATFAPTIGVAGEYEVWEWHGGLAGREEATRAVHRVAHAGGIDEVSVDQRDRQGRWNRLGTWTFAEGTAGSVTILPGGADGVAVADAVRFVHLGNHGSVRPPVPAAGP